MSNKPHLQVSAGELFEESKMLERSDPKAASRIEINGHEVLASYFMANDDTSYIEELSKAVFRKLAYVNTYEEKLWPESQINYTFMALAANEIEAARKVCAIETDYKKSHKFSILLNCKLRELLGIPLLVEEPKYKATKSEAGLFDAISRINHSQEVDWAALRKYWSATKSKRYELTVFENKDLFTEALSNAEKAFNK